MNDHPECAVAAGLSSRITSEKDYLDASLENVVTRAKAATHDPAYTDATTEYAKGKGVWDGSNVFLTGELESALESAAAPENAASVEKIVGGILWVAEAATAYKCQYLTHTAEQISGTKRTASKALAPTHPDADERRKNLGVATAAAARKIRGEVKAKEEKAAEGQ